MPEADDRIKTLIEAAHNSIAACDAATRAMEVERRKPAPMLGLHPLAQRIARRHDPNEEVDMRSGFLRCSCCDALAPIACECDRPLYVRAGKKFVQRSGFEPRGDATEMQRKRKGRPRSGKALSSTERSRRRRAKVRLPSSTSSK